MRAATNAVGEAAQEQGTSEIGASPLAAPDEVGADDREGYF